MNSLLPPVARPCRRLYLAALLLLAPPPSLASCLPVGNLNLNTAQSAAAELGGGCGKSGGPWWYASYETGIGGDRIHLGAIRQADIDAALVFDSVSYIRQHMHKDMPGLKYGRHYSGLEFKVSAVVVLMKAALLFDEGTGKPMITVGIGAGI